MSRAFLGIRLDCAQCHDHPFQPWKQADFRGLAAFFGSVHSNLAGRPRRRNDVSASGPQDAGKPATVEPRVPFHPELLPAAGALDAAACRLDRQPRHPDFARATVNRVWALLFGRPLVDPVDDLPAADELPPALVLLAGDFAAHGYDLHRLIRIIAATDVFRLDSRPPTPAVPTARTRRPGPRFL